MSYAQSYCVIQDSPLLCGGMGNLAPSYQIHHACIIIAFNKYSWHIFSLWQSFDKWLKMIIYWCFNTNFIIYMMITAYFDCSFILHCIQVQSNLFCYPLVPERVVFQTGGLSKEVYPLKRVSLQKTPPFYTAMYL